MKLVSKEKPAERTRDAYRFEVKVPAGKSATLDVAEERDLMESVAITNADDESIRLLIDGPGAAAVLKDALKKMLEMRAAQAKTQRELAELLQQLSAITDDQARLRSNLKEMPPTADAYKRYLAKFDRQETEIEKLQEKVHALQTKAAEQRQAFEAYLLGLELECPVEGDLPIERLRPAPQAPPPTPSLGTSYNSAHWVH
jgi:hypothetical protein